MYSCAVLLYNHFFGLYSFFFIMYLRLFYKPINNNAQSVSVKMFLKKKRVPFQFLFELYLNFVPKIKVAEP